MKIFLDRLPLLLLAFALTAGAGRTAAAQSASGHAHHGASRSEAESQDTLSAERPEGVQVIEIAVSPSGYTPSRLALKANVPTRLVFTRKAGAGCQDKVQIPAFGIKPTPLPVGEPVAVEFTPTESGEFAFTCGMNMLKGALLVKS